jgi:sugar O-acyltransferase (sialic acid O-acetyltransferase NeuD family)
MHISIGAGGLAKQILPMYKGDGQYVFFDEDSTIKKLHSHSVIHDLQDIKRLIEEGDSVTFSICLGNPSLRKKFHMHMIEIGANPINLISNESSIATDQQIGKGNIILGFSLIETDSRIGDGNLINSFVGIFHDSTIGNFNEIMPGAKILGGASIGNECRIGTNATILPNIKLCDGAIIGAGAVVTRNIEEPGTYVGIPAKRIKK